MIDIIIIETLYVLIIGLSSLWIFLRTHRLYRFSRYKGLLYFSSAFLLLAAGFFIRYILMLLRLVQGQLGTIQEFNMLTIVMETLLMIPGFLLLYSFFWKSVQKQRFLGTRFLPIGIISSLAVIFAVSDFILQGFYFMYISQIASFLMASAICLTNYLKRRNTHLQLMLISMILFLIVWMINLVAQYTIDLVPMIRLYAYMFTAAACLMILLTTLRLTRDYR